MTNEQASPAKKEKVNKEETGYLFSAPSAFTASASSAELRLRIQPTWRKELNRGGHRTTGRTPRMEDTGQTIRRVRETDSVFEQEEPPWGFNICRNGLTKTS